MSAHAEAGAGPDGAFQIDEAVVVARNRLDGRKSQARAFAWILGGEEGREDFSADFWRYARAGITNTDTDVRARSVALFPQKWVVVGRILQFDREVAP